MEPSTVEIPSWAWVVMGGTFAILGSQGLRFVFDVILVQIKGKDGNAGTASAIQGVSCPTSCKPQWEGAIAQAISNAERSFGDRLDRAVARIHERLDTLAK